VEEGFLRSCLPRWSIRGFTGEQGPGLGLQANMREFLFEYLGPFSPFPFSFHILSYLFDDSFLVSLFLWFPHCFIFLS